MKRNLLILLMLISAVLFTACTTKTKSDIKATPAPIGATASESPEVTEGQKEKVKINITALKGPTAIGMVKVMDDSASGKTANDYDFKIAGAPEELTVGIVKGDIDIAAVPCNLASVLYNKTNGAIKMAGINTLGVLYIVETGDTIKTVEDLKGKTIYSTGLGTTPQYTLNYLLTSHGINPEKDVTIEYKSEPTEVASLLEKSGNAIAMLPQPYVTTVMMKNPKVHIALDVAKEWDKSSKGGSSVVTGVVIVNKKFLEKNQQAFDDFMKEYKKSSTFVNLNKEEASALVEKFDIFKAAPIKKAIPYCNITMIQGDDMKKKVSGYLDTLFRQNPKAVGGKLPDDNFYYVQ